jgi:endonuclease YncB( thermonuclease family)
MHDAKARLAGQTQVDGNPVYDGDTFDLLIRPWIRSYELETIRLRGVDTDELYSTDHSRAVEQRQYTENWLHEKHESNKQYPLRITAYGYDSFGRVIADVEDLDGNLLNQEIIDEYTGIKYTGD